MIEVMIELHLWTHPLSWGSWWAWRSCLSWWSLSDINPNIFHQRVKASINNTVYQFSQYTWAYIFVSHNTFSSYVLCWACSFTTSNLYLSSWLPQLWKTHFHKVATVFVCFLTDKAPDWQQSVPENPVGHLFLSRQQFPENPERVAEKAITKMSQEVKRDKIAWA